MGTAVYFSTEILSLYRVVFMTSGLKTAFRISTMVMSKQQLHATGVEMCVNLKKKKNEGTSRDLMIKFLDPLLSPGMASFQPLGSVTFQ